MGTYRWPSNRLIVVRKTWVEINENKYAYNHKLIWKKVKCHKRNTKCPGTSETGEIFSTYLIGAIRGLGCPSKRITALTPGTWEVSVVVLDMVMGGMAWGNFLHYFLVRLNSLTMNLFLLQWKLKRKHFMMKAAWAWIWKTMWVGWGERGRIPVWGHGIRKSGGRKILRKFRSQNKEDVAGMLTWAGASSRHGQRARLGPCCKCQRCRHWTDLAMEASGVFRVG